MKDFTFGQAKQMLARAPYLHGTASIGEQINNAVSALAGLNGWECLRRLVRTSSATPVFTLPQGVAGLVRVCVNGSPASVHGTDYQFLHSGPGDLEDFVRRGFRPLRGADVADLGYSPVLSQPPEPVFLAATAAHVDEGRAQAPVSVAGSDANGEHVRAACPVVQGFAGDAPDYSVFRAAETPAVAVVDSVALDAHADDYISLWGMGASGRAYLLGHYHPSIQAPKFRQYRIGAGRGPFDILAEVRVDPLPMVNDDDVVPLPSLEPVRLMMLYDAYLELNETATAQQYMQQAVQWLQQMQAADNTVQTPVVQNVLFEGSGGDIEPSCFL